MISSVSGDMFVIIDINNYAKFGLSLIRSNYCSIILREVNKCNRNLQIKDILK
jgi:hypothetical protein